MIKFTMSHTVCVSIWMPLRSTVGQKSSSPKPSTKNTNKFKEIVDS